jgi:hypothetical protein
MRLVHTAPDLVELRGRRSIRGPLLVGGVLLFGPALATLLAAPPLTTSRVLVAAVIATIAAGLIGSGWPKLRQVRIDPRQRTIQVGSSVPAALGEGAWLQLGPAPAHAPTGPARYGVILERREASPVLLLASENPSIALRELSFLREALPLPVAAGWGLPADGVPWVDRGGTSAARAEGRGTPDEFVGQPARRRAATTLMVGAAAIATGIALHVSRRVAQGDAPHPVSLALPVLGIAALLAVAVAVGTEGARLSVGTALVCEERVWGLTYARYVVPRASIRRAHLVGPRGTDARHVLLDTTDGPVAFPCDTADGERVIAALALDS